jgi:hypothetical protein
MQMAIATAISARGAYNFLMWGIISLSVFGFGLIQSNISPKTFPWLWGVVPVSEDERHQSGG